MTTISQAERAFQDALAEYLTVQGWKVSHFRQARTKDGWRTAVAYDGAGFPDLVAVRERVVFIECKSEKGKLSPNQEAWNNALVNAHAESYILRPEDWPWIEGTFGR
jgi:hypothetical protein